MTGQAQPQSLQAYDVFLSYNRSDEQAVRELRTLLHARGLRTFFDVRNLAGGLPWPMALEHCQRRDR
jgi:hypothetical protein